MPKIEAKVEAQGLLKQLKAKIVQAMKDSNIYGTVGYTANYAFYVHEDLDAAHGTKFNEKYASEIAAGKMHSRGEDQQAKFLEAPFRRLKSDGTFHSIILATLKAKMTMKQAILKCCLRLQRDSMQICPVGETGNLRGSCFVGPADLMSS